MLRPRLRHLDDAAISLKVVIVLIVILVICAFVAVPWLLRKSNYANDPNDAPGDSDNAPTWQGRFLLKLKIHVKYDPIRDETKLSGLEIIDWDFVTEKYDGQPWDLSVYGALLSNQPKDSYEIKYIATMNYQDQFKYGDEGTVIVKGTKQQLVIDQDYKGRGESGWFFMWKDYHVGDWIFHVKVKFGAMEKKVSGIITIEDDGTPLYTG